MQAQIVNFILTDLEIYNADCFGGRRKCWSSSRIHSVMIWPGRPPRCLRRSAALNEVVGSILGHSLPFLATDNNTTRAGS